MSVPELTFALFGTYEATSAYSFEFRKRNGDRITEIFLLLPPSSVAVSEPQLAELVPTLTGGFISDYGQAFKSIHISGQCHFYYVGTPRTNQDQGGNVNGQPEFIDGFSEFLKLRFMLSRYRDYAMTEDAKLLAPDFSLQELSSVNALKTWVNQQIEDGDGALADEVELIWHDYDYDDHFQVKVQEFSMNRDARDPWTVLYDVTLQAYNGDNAGTVSMKSPKTKRKTTMEGIRQVYLYTGTEHPATQPDVLPVYAPEGLIGIGS